MIGEQRGSTLIGQLLALAIIGSALIVFIAGLATSSLGVRMVERRVSAENLARQQMELIKESAYQSDYPVLAPESREGYEIALNVEEVALGLQRIRVEVYAAQEPGQKVFVLEDFKGARS